MAKHILVNSNGVETIIDIDKGASLAAIAAIAETSGAGFRLRSTSDLSPTFTLPAPLAPDPGMDPVDGLGLATWNEAYTGSVSHSLTGSPTVSGLPFGMTADTSNGTLSLSGTPA